MRISSTSRLSRAPALSLGGQGASDGRVEGEGGARRNDHSVVAREAELAPHGLRLFRREIRPWAQSDPDAGFPFLVER